MMTTTFSPAARTSTSSKRPPRMTSDWRMKASAWLRLWHAPGAEGSPPCQLTSGSSNAPIASKSPRSAASKPRRANSTLDSAIAAFSHGYSRATASARKRAARSGPGRLDLDGVGSALGGGSDEWPDAEEFHVPLGEPAVELAELRRG